MVDIVSNKIINSTSLIHFLTNDNEKYVKIKNIKTGKYIYVFDNKRQMNETNEIDYLFTLPQYTKQSFVKIIGNNIGTIFCVKPSYDCKSFSLEIKKDAISMETLKTITGSELKENCNQTVSTIINDNSLFICHEEHSELKLTQIKGKNTLFYLDGYMTHNKICLNFHERNMHGGKGKYLHMTDDGHIHTDGDYITDETNWKIELVNSEHDIIDVRIDYKDISEQIKKTTKMNIENIFSNILRLFSIYNKRYQKYLNVSINEGLITKNKIFGSDVEQKFAIQPDIVENCIYISYIYSGQLFNIYTIPNLDDVYVGSPKCHWAKFNLLKKNNEYMFRCHKKQVDKNGNYGVYLTMVERNDEYLIRSDGCFDEEESKWIIK